MTHPALVPPLAIERYRVLEPHLADGIPLADLARTGTLSERTLQRWLGRYRAEGLAGLARLPRNDRGRLHLPEHLVELTRTLATKRPRPPVAAIHRKVQELAIAHGHRTPSYAAVARVVRAIPASQIAAASDPAVYRDQHELVHRREAATSNEMWQADHTVLDILVLDDAGTPVRPWLTVIVDDHSRAIAGYFLSLDAPSALNTALALRQAIWRKPNPEWIVSGIPEQLYVDNGSDFISEHIEQACIALKIRLIHSLPGRPRGRGKIERLFSTVNTDLLTTLPGHLAPGVRNPHPVLDLTSLDTAVGEFISSYNQRTHSSINTSPKAAWIGQGWIPRMPENLEELDGLLLRVSTHRRVQRDGIHFQGQRYISPTLAPFVGHDVTIRYDPRDLSEIRVYDHDTLLCVAVDEDHPNQRYSLHDIETARRARRRQLRRDINDRIPTTPRPRTDPPTPPAPAGRPRKRLKTYEEDE